MAPDNLLTRCQEGDNEAWRSLVVQYARAVYRWALFFGIFQGDAEEITQEVFITASKKIARCRGEAQLSSWLFQITRRHAANYRRNLWFRKIVHHKEGVPKEPVELAVNGTKTHLSLELQQVLRGMPLKLVEVLIMHDLDGYSRERIATELGLPSGTVASRLARARKLFKENWSETN